MRTPSAYSLAMSRTDRRRTVSVWALMCSPVGVQPVCALPARFVQQRDDPVQQAVRDLALGEQRELVARPVGAEDRDPVGVRPEARARLAYVVGDEQVRALLPELLGCPVERARLRREPDDDGAGRHRAGATADL